MADGLKFARAMLFDVLLVDLKLPDVEGADMVRALLADYSLSQIVVITAFADLHDLHAGAQPGRNIRDEKAPESRTTGGVALESSLRRPPRAAGGRNLTP